MFAAVFFLSMWTYSEWQARRDMDRWHHKLDQFMAAKGPNAGNRFTAADGRALEVRIRHLEQQVEQLENTAQD